MTFWGFALACVGFYFVDRGANYLVILLRGHKPAAPIELSEFRVTLADVSSKLDLLTRSHNKLSALVIALARLQPKPSPQQSPVDDFKNAMSRMDAEQRVAAHRRMNGTTQ
jgi:hypothetical protein